MYMCRGLGVGSDVGKGAVPSTSAPYLSRPLRPWCTGLAPRSADLTPAWDSAGLGGRNPQTLWAHSLVSACPAPVHVCSTWGLIDQNHPATQPRSGWDI